MQLLVHLLHIMRMGMTHTNDSMSAIKVEVFLPLVVPNLTSLSFYNVHIKQGIYIK
jgi:hypothetical protein